MMQPATEYDAIVVGSGPNGMAAAITLRQAGLSVLLIEGKETVGGGMRSAELTLPGYVHDICSAVHPLAVDSPFFNSLPLVELGLEFIQPPVCAAHPFDDGTAAVLEHAVENTAHRLGADAQPYQQLISPLVASWPSIRNNVLGPFRYPDDPFSMMKFGLTALHSAHHVARRFTGKSARGLWGGMAAHSMLPLSKTPSAAIALVLMIAGHRNGWPIPKGGSQSIANALASHLGIMGGHIETGRMVDSLDELPSSQVVLLDVTPRQALKMAGQKFSNLYRWQLKRYRYGMGVFKIDWALDGPIPFTAEICRQAGTVHLGNTFEEIEQSEKDSWSGRIPKKPFVLLTQPSVFDSTRAPEGKHTAWAYCHVPSGAGHDMTAFIEQQVERFAPGFRDRILERHVMNATQMEAYNPNYVGGDINGGVADITQLFTRPALRVSPYRTSANRIYFCSSSTPPGGGVHGMCGYHAARQVLKTIFRM